MGHWAALSSSALIMIACSAEAAPPAPSVTSKAGKPSDTGKASAASNSPDARGRAVLKAQIASLADDVAFMATFAPKATVLTPIGSNEVHESDAGAGEAVAFLHPHASIKSATFDHFFASGNDKVAWFGADLHITIESRDSGSPPYVELHTVRAIELMDGAADWKVTVAAFTSVAELHEIGSNSIHDQTDAGPLANLMTSPSTLSAALGDGAIVYGTDPGERGLGTAEAKALLARWKKLTITLDAPPKIHEKHGSDYGYVMGDVHIVTKPGSPAYRLCAFVLALPGKDGAWSVVGASYGALY